MTVPDWSAAPAVALPESLPIVRIRISMRLLTDAPLPAYKGAMLRGGFGYAFKRASCPQPCWDQDTCALELICPYRWVFETPHPPQVAHLHDLRDVPRPFVIEPPFDRRTAYAAGETLEFTLVLIGSGIDHLAHFLFGFEQLGRLGLGIRRAPARLERAEALFPWQPVGQLIYQDGRALADLVAPAYQTCIYDQHTIQRRAAALPTDLLLQLRTPLRVKSRGDWMQTIDPAALVQAACWRLHALCVFHGGGPWSVDYRPVVEQARTIVTEQVAVRWDDWERTSMRTPSRPMKLGGLVGSAVLRNVSPAVRAVLLMGSLVHVGKACVFGHGEYRVEAGV